MGSARQVLRHVMDCFFQSNEKIIVCVQTTPPPSTAGAGASTPASKRHRGEETQPKVNLASLAASTAAAAITAMDHVEYGTPEWQIHYKMIEDAVRLVLCSRAGICFNSLIHTGKDAHGKEGRSGECLDMPCCLDLPCCFLLYSYNVF